MVQDTTHTRSRLELVPDRISPKSWIATAGRKRTACGRIASASAVATPEDAGAKLPPVEACKIRIPRTARRGACQSRCAQRL